MDDEHPPTPTTTAVPSSSSAAGEGGSSLSLVPHDNPGLGDASGSAAGTNLVTRVWMKRKLQFTSCYEFKKIWGDDNASSSSSGSSCGNITFYRVKPPKGFYLLGDFAESRTGELPNNPSSFFAVREHVRKLEEPLREGEVKQEDFPLLVKPKEFVPIVNDQSASSLSPRSKSRVGLWRPIPPSDDYIVLGHAATEPGRSEPPDINSVRCVHKSVLSVSNGGFMLWADRKGGDPSVWVIVPPLNETFFHPSTFLILSPNEDPTSFPFHYFHNQPTVEVLGVSLSPFSIDYSDLVTKVRHPETGFRFDKKKKALKALKTSSKTKYFTGATAVEWLVREYGLKSRKEAVVIGEQLRRMRLLSPKDDSTRPFVDDQHAFFKFEDKLDSNNHSSSSLIREFAPPTSENPKAASESTQQQQLSRIRPLGKLGRGGSTLSLSSTNGRTAKSVPASPEDSRLQSTSNVNSMDLMSNDVSITADRYQHMPAQNTPATEESESGSRLQHNQPRHIRDQSKENRNTKFSSLTKRDREQFSALMEEASGSENGQSSGPKKKEGLLKNTFRGLVKPFERPKTGVDDEELLKDTTPTKGNPSPLTNPTPQASPYSSNRPVATDKGQLFGASLDEVVAKSNLSSELYSIPLFVEHALAFLSREENITTLGLFRIAGKKPDVDALRIVYDEGRSVDMVATEVHPHTVAGVLKLFLRSLPETLLTALLYPQFLEAMQGNADTMVNVLKGLLNQMPEANYILLERLINFFVLLTAHSETNKMTASNIGALIGPNLVRRDEANPQELFKETNILNSIIEFFINNHSALFERAYRIKEPSTSVTNEVTSSANVLNDNSMLFRNSAAKSTRNDGQALELRSEESTKEGPRSNLAAQVKVRVEGESELIDLEGIEEWEGEDDDVGLDDFAKPVQEPNKRKSYRLRLKKKASQQPESGLKAEDSKRAKKEKKEALKERKEATKERKEKKSKVLRRSQESLSPGTRLSSSEKMPTRKSGEYKPDLTESDSAAESTPLSASPSPNSLTLRRSRGDSFIRRSGSLPRPLSASFQPEDLQLRLKRQSVEHREKVSTEPNVPDQPAQPTETTQATERAELVPVAERTEAILSAKHTEPSVAEENKEGQEKIEDFERASKHVESEKESDEAERQLRIEVMTGLEVERDLVRLRKGTLEQMMEEVRELEVMRITKLVREKEVDEVKRFRKVQTMKEMKEKEIQNMEREALELKRRESKPKPLGHKTFQSETKPLDTDQVVKERKAQNNREFFEKKITEVKGKTKEEIEAEVRTGKKNTSMQNSGHNPTGSTRDKAIASKLALFEQAHSTSPPQE